MNKFKQAVCAVNKLGTWGGWPRVQYNCVMAFAILGNTYAWVILILTFTALKIKIGYQIIAFFCLLFPGCCGILFFMFPVIAVAHGWEALSKWASE